MRASILLLLGCLLAPAALADAFVYLPSTPSQGPGGSAAAGQLSVMNADTGDEVKTLDLGESPSAVAISGDGSQLFVADSGDDTVRVIDTGTLEISTTFEQVATAPAGLAVSADDRWLLVAGAGTVTVMDLAASPPSPRLVTASYTGTSLALSPDGRYALSLDSGVISGSLGVSLLNLTADEALEVGVELDYLILNEYTARDVQGGYGLTVGGDGRIYVANTGADRVEVLQIDASTHSLQAIDSVSLPESSAPYDLALSADGRQLLVSLFTPNFMASGAVNVYAVEDLSAVTSLSLQGPQQWPTYHPQGIALAPDGRFALVKSLWGGTPGTVITALSLDENSGTGEVAISEGLSMLLAGRDVNAVGDFFGPDCSTCPGGRDHSAAAATVDADGKSSAGALQPLVWLALAGLMLSCRRRFFLKTV